MSGCYCSVRMPRTNYLGQLSTNSKNAPYIAHSFQRHFSGGNSYIEKFSFRQIRNSIVYPSASQTQQYSISYHSLQLLHRLVSHIPSPSFKQTLLDKGMLLPNHTLSQFYKSFYLTHSRNGDSYSLTRNMRFNTKKWPSSFAISRPAWLVAPTRERNLIPGFVILQGSLSRLPNYIALTFKQDIRLVMLSRSLQQISPGARWFDITSQSWTGLAITPATSQAE